MIDEARFIHRDRTQAQIAALQLGDPGRQTLGL